MTNTTKPYFREIMINFDFHPGFSVVQKQKNISDLHKSFIEYNEGKKILEISSKSDNPLGIKLSAFNLKIKTDDGRFVPVESAFQSSKKFVSGGPYRDIINKAPYEAKKDERIRKDGDLLIDFIYPYKGIMTSFGIEPKTFFYDWLYINAICDNKSIIDELIKYDAFTDIEFNPNKSINCQARSAAIFVSLYRAKKIKDCLKSPFTFRDEIYQVPIKHTKQSLLSTYG